ncbi:hypothetical protein DEA8626_02550 [Defluviimonas aquaemixtae]|uniref:PRC-barrel domain-containing protein n=1 Tax=Albidovulum aquaemixtae TaxID=1542388 RepID=A0A2R8BJG0_9RHOB|nr:PRC-barrel domain-containing protein [Defluviimonas aquaemixtae]SPH23487.1 hypothetical protein DEA8626_02550 [Defluviimonas aquaemixtae]
MKNLLYSTAVLAVAGTAAFAQDAMFRTQADPMELHASELIGHRVHASEAAIEGEAYEGVQEGWEDVGEVNDVILSRDGSVEAVLVDIGGFLGIGERQVALDMGALRFVSDDSTPDDDADYFLVMSASRANLEEAPEYSWDHADDKAADAADTAAETTEEMAETADPTAEPAEQTAEAADPVVETTGDATDTAMRDPIARDGFEAATEEDLTAERLTGAPAYDANDEWIGEISELVLSDDGQVTHGIIDVGGFLGIGEKPVELEIGQIDILRESDGGDVRVYVPMTREELEALPDYNN